MGNAKELLVVGDTDEEISKFEKAMAAAGEETTEEAKPVEASAADLLEQLAEEAADAPPQIMAAIKVLASFFGSKDKKDEEKPMKDDEESYGYPPPGKAASVTPIKKRNLMAAAFPVKAEAEWFENPNLTAATPLTVSDDGRIFGHIATWGTCHVGITNDCVMPPRSSGEYQFFRTGEITASGQKIAVGQITIDTGHADINASAKTAAAHYDNTGTAAADVVAGEDQFGIWVAGAIRAGATHEQVHALRAAAPSGDWRVIGGRHELVGILAVNVPGFPVPRNLAASAYGYDADGKVITIIATGNQGLQPEVAALLAAMEQRITGLETTVKPLRPVAAAAIRDRLNTTTVIEAPKTEEVAAQS